mmetsp:Transcript_6461/g.18035  ORF Transcript_6461/g.18035 Transcript_6461/m.18035 type:complete len:183 (-) Transcript_6461:114-662(-)
MSLSAHCVGCGCRALSADSRRRGAGTVDWGLVRAVAKETDRLIANGNGEINTLFAGNVVDSRLRFIQACRSHIDGRTRHESKKAVLETWAMLDLYHKWDLKLFAFWQTDEERVKSLYVFTQGPCGRNMIARVSDASRSTPSTDISNHAGAVFSTSTTSACGWLTKTEEVDALYSRHKIRMSL